MGIHAKSLKERDPPFQCEFLSVRDVARILGVSQRWVYDRIGTDRLPASVRIGLFYKFPKDQFHAWKRKIGAPSNV